MSEESKVSGRVLVQNTTTDDKARLIVIGGAGFGGAVEGNGTALLPGYNEVDATLWEACKGSLVGHIEDRVLIVSEKVGKDGKRSPAALKDLDVKEQAKVVKGCLDVRLLEVWRTSPDLGEATRIAAGEQITYINKARG